MHGGLLVDPDDLGHAATTLAGIADDTADLRVELPERNSYGHGALSAAAGFLIERLQYAIETAAHNLDEGRANVEASADAYRAVDARAAANLPRPL